MKLAILALFATAVFAQNAVVYSVNDKDAAKLQKLYEAKQAADKTFDAAKTEVLIRALPDDKKQDVYRGCTGCTPKFVAYGEWEFSEGFRAVVPVPTRPMPSPSWVIPTYGTTPVFTPAVNVVSPSSSFVGTTSILPSTAAFGSTASPLSVSGNISNTSAQ